MTLTDAVAASCAVPGVRPPETTGPHRYVAGGVHSVTNADLAQGARRVLVLSLVKIDAQSPLPDEVASLETGGSAVTVAEPDAASVEAIGPHVLDPACRNSTGGPGPGAATGGGIIDVLDRKRERVKHRRSEPMNITVFGATGRTGRRIVHLALQGGHAVKALVRTPEQAEPQEGLTLIEGDVRDAQAVQNAVAGADAVISALGTDGTAALTEGVTAIIAGMRQHGVLRIVTLGTAGILESRTEPGKLRYQSSESHRKQTFAAEQHFKAYELLRDSSLDWTVVCPTYLPDGEAEGGYRTERDALPVDGKEISTGDTAAFAFAELLRKEHVGFRVGIAY